MKHTSSTTDRKSWQKSQNERTENSRIQPIDTSKVGKIATRQNRKFTNSMVNTLQRRERSPPRPRSHFETRNVGTLYLGSAARNVQYCNMPFAVCNVFYLSPFHDNREGQEYQTSRNKDHRAELSLKSHGIVRHNLKAKNMNNNSIEREREREISSNKRSNKKQTSKRKNGGRGGINRGGGGGAINICTILTMKIIRKFSLLSFCLCFERREREKKNILRMSWKHLKTIFC